MTTAISTIPDVNRACYSSLLPDDFKERLDALYWQETTSYKTAHYHIATPLSAGESAATAPTIGASPPMLLQSHWRHVIGEWAFRLVDYFEFPRETVAICMNFVDRYLYRLSLEQPQDSQAACAIVNKQDYQLLSATCLYLAMKVTCPSCVPAETMSYLCRDVFTQQQMIDMELRVLQKLEWKLSTPTSHIFLDHYALLLEEANVNDETYFLEHAVEDAQFSLDLAVLDYWFVNQKPSHIALAALFNGLQEEEADHACLSLCRALSALRSGDGENNEEPSSILVRQCQERLRQLRDNLEVDEDDVDDEQGRNFYHGSEEEMMERLLGSSSPLSVVHRFI